MKGRTYAAVLALILVFCAGVSITAMLEFRHSPFARVPVLDEKAYINWARQIAAGEVMGQGVFYQDPLYPYFLALVFKGWGESLWAVRLIQAALGLLSVYLVSGAARKLK